MKSSTILVLAASLFAASAGHAGETAVASQPAQVLGVKLAAICATCGVVTATAVETRKGEGGPAGVVGGAVLGGVLGHQMGGGSGRTAMTVLGAVGGGVAGNAVEKKINETKVWITTVTHKDGSTRTYEAKGDPELRAGDVVKIEDGRLLRVATP
ncbi:MAG TPA: glycine zipper 2TM domain-containing protein [Caldimonas sp.]|jgi:outer membrane lipoprotein SlyB